MTRSDHSSAAEAAAIGFSDRLLAEALRALEQDGATPIADPAAEASAIEADGDLEHRIVVRARSLPVSERLAAAVRQVRRAIGLILAVGLILAAVAGASAARASLATQGDHPVNIFWAIGGLLGIQTLLLTAWTVLMVWHPAGISGASLGGAVLGLGRRLARRLHHGPEVAAAVEAIGAVYASPPLGRWVVSSISHSLWTCFNAICLVLVILMLSTRHYTFTWETTILSAESYMRLTRIVASVPRLAGFPAPTAEQIAAAEWPVDPRAAEEAQEEWSGLLIGSIVCYGLGPRILLLGFCLARKRRARIRFRLDTTRPGYLRLARTLDPASQVLGVVDADRSPARERPVPQAEGAPSRGGTGAPILIGLEVEPPSSWPPAFDGVTFRDLGFVDSRQDRNRVLQALSSPGPAPSLVVVVCALATTPDRGIAAFLEQMGRAAPAPLALVLTGGQALRRRGDAELIAARLDDRRTLAAGAGIAESRVLELDLDHLTDASLAGLASLIGAPRGAAVPHRRIEEAFDLVVEHVRGWPEAPGTREQARLHQAIASLYRPEHPSWRQLFAAPVKLSADMAAPLRAAGRNVVQLLPDRLRIRPQWIAAGAIAGALGCVAASMIAAPAAIAALPMWTAVGAAVAAIASTSTGGSHGSPAAGGPAVPHHGRGDAVRAAALFALVLELQGRGEAAITRMLDRVIDDDDESADFDTPEATRAWLDGIRHRLDLALRAEAAP